MRGADQSWFGSFELRAIPRNKFRGLGRLPQASVVLWPSFTNASELFATLVSVLVALSPLPPKLCALQIAWQLGSSTAIYGWTQFGFCQDLHDQQEGKDHVSHVDPV